MMATTGSGSAAPGRLSLADRDCDADSYAEATPTSSACTARESEINQRPTEYGVQGDPHRGDLSNRSGYGARRHIGEIESGQVRSGWPTHGADDYLGVVGNCLLPGGL